MFGRLQRGLRHFAYGLMSLAGVLAGAFPVLAAAPINDNFAAATVLSGPSNFVTASNFGATAEPGEPDHADNPVSRSVWWVWRSPFTGTVRVSTLDSDFDTELAVYTGYSISNLSLVSSDDDSDYYNTSRVLFRAYKGETFRIAVDGFSGATGNIHLAVAPEGFPAPAWDLVDVQGEPLRSASFTNNVLLMDFWETICTGCLEEMPDLIRLREQLRPFPFQMVGLYENSGSPNEVQAFANLHGMNYPVGPGDQQLEDDLGGLIGFPTKFLIDRDNKVVLRIGTTGNLAFYQSLISPLLRGPSEVQLLSTWEGANLRLEWPGVESGYDLQSSTSLAAESWTHVQSVDGLTSTTVPVAGDGARFYRLKKR